MFVRSRCNMVVHVYCYVERVGGRGTPGGIIEAERVYLTTIVWSHCNMIVCVCCYVELVSRRGTPGGIIEAERVYGLLPMARKVSSSIVKLITTYCRSSPVTSTSISASDSALEGRNEDEILAKIASEPENHAGLECENHGPHLLSEPSAPRFGEPSMCELDRPSI